MLMSGGARRERIAAERHARRRVGGWGWADGIPCRAVNID